MKRANTDLSMAVFGSLARTDTDVHSDRDLLIVSDDVDLLQENEYTFTRRGYSCSTYTWKKLEYLTQTGSLFIKHLIEESVVFSDPSGKLQLLYKSFQIRDSYQKEFWDGYRLTTLLHKTPDCAEGIRWANDALFVAFRTMAIPFLADLGVYKFSLTDIIDELVRRGLIEGHDEQNLFKLRVGKSLYRKGSKQPSLSLDELRQVSECISRAFSINCSINVASRSAIISEAFDSLTKQSDGSYFRLRLIEKAMITASLSASKTELVQIKNIRNRTTAPSAYACHTLKKESNLMTKTMKILKNHLHTKLGVDLTI
ncbi:MAG: hypothetical protein ACSHX0_08735 [Akkermansiaceae bacterium]